MPELRRYTCEVCGNQVVIQVRLIEKWVCVCSHIDTRGSILPVLQLREEGILVQDS
jgi:hypothetical protein